MTGRWFRHHFHYPRFCWFWKSCQCLLAGHSQAYGLLKYAKMVSSNHTRLLGSLGNISLLICFKPSFQLVIEGTSFTKKSKSKVLGWTALELPGHVFIAWLVPSYHRWDGNFCRRGSWKPDFILRFRILGFCGIFRSDIVLYHHVNCIIGSTWNHSATYLLFRTTISAKLT